MKQETIINRVIHVDHSVLNKRLRILINKLQDLDNKMKELDNKMNNIIEQMHIKEQEYYNTIITLNTFILFGSIFMIIILFKYYN